MRADGFACATGAAGRGAARLGGAGREESTRGGAEMKMFGRENGERFTGGWKGAKRGGADLTNGGATGDSNGSGGRSERKRGLGEASTGASLSGRGKCCARRSSCESFSRRKWRATSPRGAPAGSDSVSTASGDFSSAAGAG